jgi:hypothetical protein
MKPPIIITGCHRSGTTIAAHILGQELGCAVIDDLQFMPDKEHFDKLRVMIDNDITKFIVLCHSALQIPVHIFHVFPELHWVGITRKKEDIINSMKRIHWCKNDFTNWHQFLNDHVNHTRQLWGVAKSILPKENWTELKYESLKEHPLFIPKEQRENFTVKQWKLNEPCGMKYWENNYECYMEKMNG